MIVNKISICNRTFNINLDVNKNIEGFDIRLLFKYTKNKLFDKNLINVIYSYCINTKRKKLLIEYIKGDDEYFNVYNLRNYINNLNLSNFSNNQIITTLAEYNNLTDYNYFLGYPSYTSSVIKLINNKYKDCFIECNAGLIITIHKNLYGIYNGILHNMIELLEIQNVYNVFCNLLCKPLSKSNIRFGYTVTIPYIKIHSLQYINLYTNTIINILQQVFKGITFDCYYTLSQEEFYIYTTPLLSPIASYK